MHVVVVGGGYGGMATCVRLAKLGHEVTLVEARDRLGGAVGSVEQDGFRWDTGPSTTLLPAVMRDLFRKSGRPLERELDLVPAGPVEHRFDDDTVLRFPSGSRSGQIAALEEAFGADAGARWAAYVETFADDWEALRRDWFERPYDPTLADKHTRAVLGSRLTLHKLVLKAFKDDRLRRLALLPSLLEGHEPRNVPAWWGLWSYVEQNFGSWKVPDGMGALADILAQRLATRGVRVLLGQTVLDLEVARDGGGERVRGVRTMDGTIEADAVVCAIDPRRLPTLAQRVQRTMPAIPPLVCHLGLVGEVPDLPDQLVLHEDTTLVVRTDGHAPAGAHAWTVLGRGHVSEDLVSTLQRAGLRIRDQIEVRVDRTPKEQVVAWNGSPYGVLWQGRRTLRDRLGNAGPTTGPISGLYLAGAHTTPGAGLPSVGLSAAIVAQLIGPG